VRGAFTDARETRRGRFETADGGTIFLDEIGELPLALQSKLLRALQERQVRRVGGTSLVDVDVRVVSATNRDLRQEAAKGQFREELYYRINVIEIRLPPLRERVGDVRLLVHTFLRRYGQGRVTRCADDAMAALESYRWPGNVRELQNVVERACALADGETITAADLPDHVVHGARAGDRPSSALTDVKAAGAASELPLKDAKEQWMGVLEASYLRELLARHGGNITAAAKAAGVDRKTFHRLVTKHGIR
jgi:DNA-binding NtrC family response regulator